MSGSWFFWLVVVVSLAATAGQAWLRVQRRGRLRAWAQTTGWRYAERDDRWTTISSSHPFGQGRDHRAADVVQGLFEHLDALAFDYRWTTGQGKNRQVHHAHVVALRLPAYLPTVQVTPEGLGTVLAHLVGAQDMQFESADFNRAYRVTAGDLRTATDVINPRLMERLLRSDARHVSWRIEGTWILSWQAGGWDLDSLATRLGVLAAVVRAIPRHVWQDHGYDPLTDSTPGEAVL